MLGSKKQSRERQNKGREAGEWEFKQVEGKDVKKRTK